MKLQNDGELFFDSLAILIVYGTEFSQQGSLISLGYGTILFKNNIFFKNGGIFDAGSGVLSFQSVTWENKSGSTFIPGTSTVILQASLDQSIIIDSSLNFQFYDLQLLSQGTVSINGSVTVQNDCYIAAGCTLNVPSGSSFTVNGTFMNDGVITGGGSYSTPVPVQLSSFIATANGNGAVLRWTTETELNNYGFDIERRRMPATEDWTIVSFVQGAGTSSSPKDYSYIEAGLRAGRYAYRLKQIDLNGSFAYSNSAEVEVGLGPQEFMLGQNYPNPFNPTTTVEFILPHSGRAILKVYAITGQEVATLFDREVEAGGVYKTIFEAARFSSGIYFARLNFGGKSLFRRMTLLK